MGRRDEFFLLDVASEILRRPALEAGCIVYLPRALANCSLPARKPASNEFSRRNGACTLTIVAPSHIGLPYGTYPRLMILHLATQAKLHGERDIFLDETLTKFLASLGKRCSGGANGTITALRQQAHRLFASTIIWQVDSGSALTIDSLRISSSASIFWQPQNSSEWGCRIRLDESFFQDVIEGAVPVDARVIRALSASTLCIDLYGWLTYRNYSLRRPSLIRWDQLAAQFGNGCGHIAHFRQQFLSALSRVSILYPDARYDVRKRGLLLFPSPPHVPPMNMRNSSRG